MTEHDWSPVLPNFPQPDRGHGCLRCGTTVLNLAAGEATTAPCSPPDMDRVLTVKAVKLFRGHDGHGFNATLYVDGKRVCLAIDAANGGPYDYQCKNYAVVTELQRWARVKSQSLYWDQLDLLVGDLVAEADLEKRLRRLCRTKTVAKLTTDPEGQHSVWAQAYTPAFGDSLRARHGDDLVEIVNERLVGKKEVARG